MDETPENAPEPEITPPPKPKRKRTMKVRYRAIETAFAQYCAMGSRKGERSLVKLARANCTSETNFRTLRRRYEKWSLEHDWQARVLEYDRAKEEEKRAKREAELEKMEEEHALVARSGVLLASKRIKELMEANEFGPYSSVQLLKVASDLERIARGGATQRIEEKSEKTVTIEGQVGFYSPVQLPAKQTLTALTGPQQVVEGTVVTVEETSDEGKLT